jgi:hypothetical protein
MKQPNQLIDRAFFWSFGVIIGAVILLIFGAMNAEEAFRYSFLIPIHILLFAYINKDKVKEIYK